MNILAIVQARSNSTRFPNKVTQTIEGKSLLEIQIQRMLKSKHIEQFIIATTTDAVDDAICDIAQKMNVPFFRGSEENVLDRFYQSAKDIKPNYVVRLTGDCPLIDAQLIDELIENTLKQDAKYGANCLTPIYPDGQDAEIFTFDLLEEANQKATTITQKEHVTPYISQKAKESIQKSDFYEVKSNLDYGHIRMTVDTKEDFLLIEKLIERLGTEATWKEYTKLIESEKELSSINSSSMRNEGALSSEKQDIYARYTNSNEFLERALKTIPLGSQTFSKSKTQLPMGVSPFFASKAEGAYMWDVDGNKYLDFINGLLSINLGYKDLDILGAVKKQLEIGTIFSIPHELEFLVAEKLCEMVPCAEMVRFGKNGSDATAGAIRVARAYTQKDHVLVCGYHGWQDWYIGTTTRSLGVPQAVKDLSHQFAYNDIDSLEKLMQEYKGKVAAVIMEPSNVVAPKEGFLEKVKEITHQNDALLIFDETITGFRFSAGGAQELYGVTPDLATFGKGMANGYPLSAVAGRRDVMKFMEDIFFSSTFGGETLSLAASLATMTKIQTQPVISHINKIGTLIMEKLEKMIEEVEMQDIFEVSGHPSWSFFLVKDEENYWKIKTLLIQEMFANNIYYLGTHNVTYAHTEQHVEDLMKGYRIFFDKMKQSQMYGIDKFLFTKPLVPLFKVR
ncbi:MAG: aminotransferase [Flexibacter sp. CG_4_10_14_3_um_filter_32_15]|nr:MAG: aminotransferase [Flexibacter sp. CG_4_10_14_3_um_filter_32_15]